MGSSSKHSEPAASPLISAELHKHLCSTKSTYRDEGKELIYCTDSLPLSNEQGQDRVRVCQRVKISRRVLRSYVFRTRNQHLLGGYHFLPDQMLRGRNGREDSITECETERMKGYKERKARRFNGRKQECEGVQESRKNRKEGKRKLERSID